jgi:cardiolipin synthase A/B
VNGNNPTLPGDGEALPPAEHCRVTAGRLRRWWRPVLAVLGIAFAAFFFVVSRQVLAIVEKPSWPPAPDAITSADAQQAVEEFAARSDPRPSDVAMPYAWSTAATIEPWPEGKNFFPKIFADVRAAQSSVHILMFGWREGEIGTQLSDLLIEKMKEGVEVRVLVDVQGSQVLGPAGPMFTRLADAGAQIVVNDLLPWDRDGLYPDHRSFDWRQDEVGRADHRKLYVIDGNVAWTGGAGIEDHFANGKFHDVMVRVTGNVVRQAQALFLMSFHAHGGPLPSDLSRYFPSQPQPGKTPIALLQTVPGGFVSATQATRELFDTAKTRLDVMNPYFTDADMVQRLAAAARRGVKVRIVVSQTSNNAPATAALKHHYGDLIDAGATIYEYPGAVVHAKLVVADDTVVFGTVNLDAWALYRNYEIAMMARSAQTAALMEQRVFEPDIAKSRPGTPPSGLRTRFKDWTWDKLAYFL